MKIGNTNCSVMVPDIMKEGMLILPHDDPGKVSKKSWDLNHGALSNIGGNSSSSRTAPPAQQTCYRITLGTIKPCVHYIVYIKLP